MNYCPNCGSPLENGKCPNCGFVEDDSIIDGDAVEKESKVVNDFGINEHKQYENKSEDLIDFTKTVPAWIKVLLIVITIFVHPLIGFICSIVLISRPYPLYKSFGIKLLILSIILIILYVVFGILRGIISLFIVGLHSVAL
jgi:hypothetical protein